MELQSNEKKESMDDIIKLFPLKLNQFIGKRVVTSNNQIFVYFITSIACAMVNTDMVKLGIDISIGDDMKQRKTYWTVMQSPITVENFLKILDELDIAIITESNGRFVASHDIVDSDELIFQYTENLKQYTEKLSMQCFDIINNVFTKIIELNKLIDSVNNDVLTFQKFNLKLEIIKNTLQDIMEKLNSLKNN